MAPKLRSHISRSEIIPDEDIAYNVKVGRMILSLSVPFREKEEAKALGAKWNAKEKTWYIDLPPRRLRADDRKAILNWFPIEPRHWLTCSDFESHYAELRGAFRDAHSNRVFIPHGYADDDNGLYVLYRMPYWLPDHPEFVSTKNGGQSRAYDDIRRSFPSHEAAALKIANNCIDMAVDFYLPEERAAMDQICEAQKMGWYVNRGDKQYPDTYRHSVWDTW
jgi:hypothetical protein